MSLVTVVDSWRRLWCCSVEKTFKESVAIDDYHLHAAEMMEQAFNVMLECIVSHSTVSPRPA